MKLVQGIAECFGRIQYVSEMHYGHERVLDVTFVNPKNTEKAFNVCTRLTIGTPRLLTSARKLESCSGSTKSAAHVVCPNSCARQAQCGVARYVENRVLWCSFLTRSRHGFKLRKLPTYLQAMDSLDHLLDLLIYHAVRLNGRLSLKYLGLKKDGKERSTST